MTDSYLQLCMTGFQISSLVLSNLKALSMRTNYTIFWSFTKRISQHFIVFIIYELSATKESKSCYCCTQQWHNLVSNIVPKFNLPIYWFDLLRTLENVAPFL